MPTLTVSFDAAIADEFDDYLEFLNKDRPKESKYPTINAYLSSVLREYVAAAWEAYLSWLETKQAGNVNVGDVPSVTVSSDLNACAQGDTTIELKLSEYMLAKLQTLVAWEQGVYLKTQPGYKVAPTLGYRLKNVLIGTIVKDYHKMMLWRLENEERGLQ